MVVEFQLVLIGKNLVFDDCDDDDLQMQHIRWALGQVRFVMLNLFMDIFG